MAVSRCSFIGTCEGNLDENSSAWIRVMLPADRLQDTHLYIPKLGTEVVVGFLQGDPSLPIVLGSVYNDIQMPPLLLPNYKNGLHFYFPEKVCWKVPSGPLAGKVNLLRTTPESEDYFQVTGTFSDTSDAKGVVTGFGTFDSKFYLTMTISFNNPLDLGPDPSLMWVGTCNAVVNQSASVGSMDCIIFSNNETTFTSEYFGNIQLNQVSCP